MPAPKVHADKIEMRELSSLRTYEKNARTHPEAQLAALAKIVSDSGFTSPLLIEADGTIIGGHGRALVAERLGMTKVPCVVVKGLSPAQIKALRLSDNAVGLLSEWDSELVSFELAELRDLDFDLDLTGFGADEITDMLAAPAAEERDADEAPDAPTDPVTVVGDLWLLGRHRVLCGSALDPDALAKLLDGEVPDFANCDPPYGINAVPRNGKMGNHAPFGSKGAKGSKTAVIQAGVYAPIIGDRSTKTAVGAYRVLADSGIPIICLWGGNYYSSYLPNSPGWLVWNKEASGNFADAELAWTNSKKAIRLFTHQWSGMLKDSERNTKRVHPTQKPVALAAWVRQTLAPRAKSVIDLFIGSGSVLVDAETAKITFFGMELAPAYVDVSITRWEKLTGQEARHEDGRTFAEVKAERQPG